MQRAIEQAGSVFTGWISSCLFYLDSSSDDERSRHQQALKQKGAEREMQICHSQPHLVPPMKLVVYDDLPSPGPPRASSFPTWVMEEGRNLASRASSRASMSFRRKSTAPVRISAPTDFRRVTTLPPISTALTGYRPLELSFQSPLNELPELPRFDFGFEQDQSQQMHIVRPPRSLSFMTEFSYQTRPRTHRPSSSFHLPRKPVGSGSRRSSLATLELLMEKQVPITHPLIPHFSTRSSTTSVATGLATSVPNSPPTWPESIVGRRSHSNSIPFRMSHDATAAAVLNLPKPTTPQDKSLPPIPSKTPLSSPSHFYEPPRTPVDNGPLEPSTNPFPSRSSRVTQWLLQTNSTTKPQQASPPQHPRKPSLSDKVSMRLRTRTLSGSTLASFGNTINAPTGFKATPTIPTPPLSHTITPATTMTTARTSTLDSRLDKDFEVPFGPRHTQSRTPSAEQTRAHPTIYEAQQQHSLHNPFDYYTHDNQRHSAIGVAFQCPLSFCLSNSVLAVGICFVNIYTYPRCAFIYNNPSSTSNKV
ncbi:hypothetical protein BJX70DRAFT_281160 [Aspergillus crustosus]